MAISHCTIHHGPEQLRERARVWGALFLVLGFLATPAMADCRDETALDKTFTVCTFDPANDRIVMALSDRQGTPYGRFSPYVEAERAMGRTVRFAMNGGMYDASLKPIGLYIEDGRTLKKANTNDGPGNFHLLPNGVFHISDGRAGITETKRYVADAVMADFATQSGPMLVLGGQFHPRLLKDSTSRKYRNGVGIVQASGEVAFAISRQPVTFWEFATLFRDVLGCQNALFLDGTISSLYAPDIGRRDFLFPVGPIIAVVE